MLPILGPQDRESFFEVRNNALLFYVLFFELGDRRSAYSRFISVRRLEEWAMFEDR